MRTVMSQTLRGENTRPDRHEDSALPILHTPRPSHQFSYPSVKLTICKSVRSGRCGFSSPARGMSLTSAMSPIGELLKSIAFLPNPKPVFAGRACGHVALQLAFALAFI